MEEERAARMEGRPKSTKEGKLEQVKLLEAEEYRSTALSQAMIAVGQTSACSAVSKDECLWSQKGHLVVSMEHARVYACERI